MNRFLNTALSVPKRTDAYLDVLKLLAIFMVLWNHTGIKGFSLYTEITDAPWHLPLMAFSVFIKIAVPLFFMTSGALLLGRQESYGQIFGTRVLRFAAILLIASFVTYWLYEKTTPFSWADFFSRFYSNDIHTPYWYLYSYIAYLLMLPLLRRMAASMEQKDYLWLLAAHLIMSGIAALDFALFHGERYHTSHFAFYIDYSYVVYSLFGYYIARVVDRKDLTGDGLMVWVILSVAAIGFTCVLTESRSRYLGGWSESDSQKFFSSFIAIPTITVFYAARLLYDGRRMSERRRRTLYVLGACTFGTYLFEKTWRFTCLSVYDALLPQIGSFAASLVYILAACTLGICVSFVWRVGSGAVRAAARQYLRDRES